MRMKMRQTRRILRWRRNPYSVSKRSCIVREIDLPDKQVVVEHSKGEYPQSPFIPQHAPLTQGVPGAHVPVGSVVA